VRLPDASAVVKYRSFQILQARRDKSSMSSSLSKRGEDEVESAIYQLAAGT